MGVSGLKTYLETKHEIYSINIRKEIKEWLSLHPNNPAILIFDVKYLSYLVCNPEEALCGGRHQIYTEIFVKLFRELKNAGATLVFFSAVSEHLKVNEKWLEFRNDEQETYKKIYRKISEGHTLQDILADILPNNRMVTFSMSNLFIAAERYGKIYYSTDRSHNLGLAQYATANKAFAIIGNDTDFLIFHGQWKYWSITSIDLANLTIDEYNRNAIAVHLSLNSQKRPLFATLMGNNFTKKYFLELRNFHRSIETQTSKNKFENVARYINSMGRTSLSSEGIVKVAIDFFGANATEEQKFFFMQSVGSYNLNHMGEERDEKDTIDPIIEEILDDELLRFYHKHKRSNHLYYLQLYLIRECDDNGDRTLPSFIIEWLRKRIGIFRYHDQNRDNIKFTLFIKRNTNKDIEPLTQVPIYPPFSPPPILELLKGDRKDSALNGCRWKIFSWILSIPERKLEKLKFQSKKYLLSCVTLLVLVMNDLISIEVADGILYTIKTVISGKDKQTKIPFPTLLNEYFVLSAHIFNITFSEIRSCFFISGLLPCISTTAIFDGVYFQNLMISISKKEIHTNDIVESIKELRIYEE